MPRIDAKKGSLPKVGDVCDPHGMAAHFAAFLEWMRVRGYSEQTIHNTAVAVSHFARWCAERGVSRSAEVTKPLLVRYQRHLYHYRTKGGMPLSFKSQRTRLQPLRAFFKYLSKNNLVLYNPAADLEMPRLEKRLPRCVLSASEAESVINVPDVETDLGVRDRAILETFYSTGMRRMELVSLKLYDLDAERGTVMVRQGKGKKDRMIPIGERALAWIEKYLSDVRPSLVVEPDDGTLFITSRGEPFSGMWMSSLVREYVTAANIGKKGACHLFRHAMATLMLENGADIRFIQAMLGHADLSTTQVYTQVSIRKLKEIHTATHPAKMTRTSAAARILAGGIAKEDVPVAETVTAASGTAPAPKAMTNLPSTPSSPDARAALALPLAAEEEDEG
jgi:integrase/recombinase XerD